MPGIAGMGGETRRLGRQPHRDAQGDQIFATTGPIAERARKIGGTTLRSTGQIRRLQRIGGMDRQTLCGRNSILHGAAIPIHAVRLGASLQ